MGAGGEGEGGGGRAGGQEGGREGGREARFWGEGGWLPNWDREW